MSLVLPSFSLLFSATFSQSGDKWPPQPCDPLVPQFCTLPYPNNYWLLMDYSNDTGEYSPDHLVLSESNFPVDIFGETISPSAWNNLDGFSPISSINAYFQDIDISSKGSNLAPLWNISQSLSLPVSSSPIVLINANTGERLAYWVELDHSSDNIVEKESNHTLMIWPAKRLEDGERYIIALQNLVMDNGESVTVSDAFIELRDNKTSSNNAVEQRRNYYETEIFKYLERIGMNRNNLQLAWDFTVMSTNTQTHRMISMREDAFSRILSDDGNKVNIKYTIDEITDDYSQYVYRKINGRFTVPWYLNQREPGVKVRLITDWSDVNTAVYQHDADVPFEMLIPRSVANRSMEGRILQYGHGLFGNYHEIETTYLQQQSNQYGYVIGGVDWLGMSSDDVEAVTQIITFNLTDFPSVPDRLHQGMLDALLYMKLTQCEEFQNDPQIWAVNNISANVNFNNRNYYGNSNGGIMGSVYMSLTTDVTHGVCGVPGGPYSLLLPRSKDFRAFQDILYGRYTNDIDRVLIFNTLGDLWTRLEPAGYMHHISRDLFEDTPKHTVMLHYGLGDAQVTWMGAKMLGRSINASMYESNVEEGNVTLYGFEFLNDKTIINTSNINNYGKNLIQGWNYNLPQVPFVNRPPEGFDSHEYTRRQPEAIEANHKFFTQGIIYNPCDGPCEGTPTKGKELEIMMQEYKNSAKYRSMQYMRKKADTFLNGLK